MLDQIIYTSCCYGLDLFTGEKTQTNYGLKVYSYSEKLRGDYSREELVRLEKLLASCSLWDDSPNTPARAYCYHLMSDGRGLFMKSRIANVTEGRGFYLSHAFLGKFQFPPAFSIDSADWVTDEQLISTDGMSDQVYQIKHGDTSTAPSPAFLARKESLLIHYSMRDVEKVIRSTQDSDSIVKILAWLLTPGNENRTLCVRFQPKVDKPDEDFYADRVSDSSKEDVQLLSEYVCWLLSYMLPAHSAAKLSFAVGVDAGQVAEFASDYRILFVPVREDRDMKGGESYASEKMSDIRKLVQLGDADTISWNSSESSFSLNPAVIGSPYFRWVKSALDGDSSSLRDFKKFCNDELSYASVNEELTDLAYIFEQIKEGRIESVGREVLRERLMLLEKYDEEYNYEETASRWVKFIYSGYGENVQKDALKGFPILREMYDYYSIYDSLPKEDCIAPVTNLIDSLMVTAGITAKDVFDQIIALKESSQELYDMLAKYVVSNVARYAEEMGNGGISSLNVRWKFVTHILNERGFPPENPYQILVNKSAVCVRLLFNEGVSDILDFHASDRKEDFLKFVHTCAEKLTDSVREKLYTVALEIFAQKYSVPDKDVLLQLIHDSPQTVSRVLQEWLNINHQATVSLALSQLNPEDAQKWIAEIMPHASPEIISTLLATQMEYSEFIRNMLRERVTRESYSRYNKGLLKLYIEDCRRNGFSIGGKVKGICLCNVLEEGEDVDDIKKRLATFPKFLEDIRNPVSKLPALTTGNCCNDFGELDELLNILEEQFKVKLSSEIKARTRLFRSKKNPEEAAYTLMDIYSSLVIEDTGKTYCVKRMRSYFRALLETVHYTGDRDIEAFAILKLISRKIYRAEDSLNNTLYSELRRLLSDTEIYSKKDFERLFKQMEVEAEEDERLSTYIYSLKKEAEADRALLPKKPKGFLAGVANRFGRIMSSDSED